MRLLLQRVTRAKAVDTGDGERPLATIGRGLVVFAGFEPADTESVVLTVAQKLRALRIFSDAQRKMNLAAEDAGAEYLISSQFTLYGDVRGGNRPYFGKAAGKEQASTLYTSFVEAMKTLAEDRRVKHTPFGSDLQIELVNDGPVTLWLDSKELW